MVFLKVVAGRLRGIGVVGHCLKLDDLNDDADIPILTSSMPVLEGRIKVVGRVEGTIVVEDAL